jgi:predicted phosphodiesterase
VLSSLSRALRTRPRDWPSPQLLFVTGDLTQSGKPDQFLSVSTFLDTLLTATGLSKDRLFVLPGNHDVDRTHVAQLTRTLSTEDESVAYFAAKSRKYHFDKFTAFSNWHNSYFGATNAWIVDRTVQQPLVITIDGTRIGILRINSSLFSAGDDDFGKLWIGRRCLHEALQETHALTADYWIALTHHPLSWLHPSERRNIKSELTAHVDCLLHGHLHDTDVESVAGLNGTVVQLAAGATYQTREYLNSALFSSLDAEQDTISVLPITYHDSPAETWSLDTSIYPHDDGFRRQYSLARRSRHVGPAQTSTNSDTVQSPASLLRRPVVFHIGTVVPPEHFVARRTELVAAQEIVASRQSFQLVGRKRVGKTSFGRKLLTLIEASDDPRFTSRRIIPTYFNLERLVQQTVAAFLEHTLIAILTAARRRIFAPLDPSKRLRDIPAEHASDEVYRSLTQMENELDARSSYRSSSNDPQDRLNGVSKPLRPYEFRDYATRIVSTVRDKGFDTLLVFFDEANHLPEEWAVEFFDNNADIFESPGLVSIYATSPELSDSVDKLQETFGHSITLGPFESQQDLIELINRYLGLDSTRAELPLSADAVQLVWTLTSGLPYEIQLLLQDSFTQAWRSGALCVSHEHVNAAHAGLCRTKPAYFPVRRL